MSFEKERVKGVKKEEENANITKMVVLRDSAQWRGGRGTKKGEREKERVQGVRGERSKEDLWC